MATRDGTPFCPQCGYDLRGQTISRCPECGLLYNEEALELEAREAFYACLCPYLESITPLLPSAVVSAIRLSAGLTYSPGWACIAPLLLVPFLSRVVQNQIRGEKPPRQVGPFPVRNVMDLIGPATALGGLLKMGFRKWFIYGAISFVLSSLFLLLGMWHLRLGAKSWAALRAVHQDQSMPSRRARMLERADQACWMVAIGAAILWTVTLGQVLFRERSIPGIGACLLNKEVQYRPVTSELVLTQAILASEQDGDGLRRAMVAYQRRTSNARTRSVQRLQR